MRLVVKDRRLLVRDGSLIATDDVSLCPCCGGGDCGCGSQFQSEQEIGPCFSVSNRDNPIKCGNSVNVTLDGRYEEITYYPSAFGGGVNTYSYISAIGARWNLVRKTDDLTCQFWDASLSTVAGSWRWIQRSYRSDGTLRGESDTDGPITLAKAPVGPFNTCANTSDGAYFAVGFVVAPALGKRQIWLELRASGEPDLIAASKQCSTSVVFRFNNGNTINTGWTMQSSRNGDDHTYDYQEAMVRTERTIEGFDDTTYRLSGSTSYSYTVVTPCDGSSGRGSRPQIRSTLDVLLR